ncbi:MAG TPA: glycosyltransferase family 39 protein [Planctomycetota bacterium]|nr:glycosyltransferase family 39 protein [Planctomycetota bacterium]
MKRELPLVIAIALLALALRFAAARDMSYWDDDVGTIGQAHRIDSLHELLRPTNDWHPPLSFLFTKAWLKIGSLSGKPGEELAIRAPFFACGALSVVLAWLVARRMLGRGALLVALGVAVSPLLVWSDRDIRGYALLVPLALGATLSWLRAQETKRALDWAGFAVLGSLACWDHYNAIPFVGALLLLSFIEGKRLEVALSSGAVATLYLPWAPALVEHLRTIPFGRHEQSVQLAIPPVMLTAPAYTLFGLVLGYTIFPWNLAIVLPVALAAGALVVGGATHRRAVVLGLILPLVLAAFTPFRMPRYHVASVPFLLILLVHGSSRIRRGGVLLGVVLAGMLASDVELLRGREHHFLFPLHPWRQAEKIVRERPAPVVYNDLEAFIFAYVPDLVGPAAPVSSACWLIVDEKTTEADEDRLHSHLVREGFHLTQDQYRLLTDFDHAARTRWVGRGTREFPVRLLRYEK